MPDRWVVLDVGETLVDETRVFRTWAEIFGLPELTLMAVLGGSISNADNADDWRRFFELIQHPDWRDSRPDFEARYGALRPDDLYPDALPRDRRSEGARISGRDHGQPAGAATCGAGGPRRERRGDGNERRHGRRQAGSGVLRPDARADRLSVTGRRRVRGRPGRQRRAASAAAGMRAVWLRRGPWGLLHEDRDGIAHLVVRSLDELVERIDEAWPLP